MGVDSRELTQEVVDLEAVPVYLDESSTVVVGRPNTYARGWNECRELVLLNNHGHISMTTEPMTRANIFLPPEMLARLKEQKDRTGVPVAEFVRRAIEAALQKVNL